jgi:hypothetical protein
MRKVPGAPHFLRMGGHSSSNERRTAASLMLNCVGLTDPAYLARRELVVRGMRLAGVPEG